MLSADQGEVVISVTDLLKEFKNYDTGMFCMNNNFVALWGRKSFTREMSIIKNKKENGKVKIQFTVQFQRFPTTQYSKDDELVNYHDLYLTLVSKMVRSRVVDNESGATFTPLEKSILDNYCKLYGISPLFYDLAQLRGLMTQKTSSLIPDAKQINDLVLFLYESKKIMCRAELDLLDTMFSDCNDKLLAILCDFFRYFPNNEPQGGLAALYDIINLLRNPSSLKKDEAAAVSQILGMDTLRVCF